MSLPDSLAVPSPSLPSLAGRVAALRRWAARVSSGWAGRVLAGGLVPVAGVALWYAVAEAGLLAPQILPAPAEVWAVMADMLSSGELADHLLISLARVVQGFAAGTVVGLLLGVAMGTSWRLDALLRPLFLAVAQIPALGWVPLVMLLVGIDEALKVIIIAKAAMIPVALNTRTGIRGVPRHYVEVARVFRFSRWQTIRRVFFPATVAPVFTGVRYGMTHAWLALVAVELLASTEGLGYLMVWGRQMFQLDVVIVAMIAVGLVGLLLDRGLEATERRLSRWRPLAA